MKLKILYINTDTNETLKELELTEEETKALSLDIADIIEFHTNFIKQRVRQNIDKIVEEALRSQSRLLSAENKKAIIKVIICSLSKKNKTEVQNFAHTLQTAKKFFLHTKKSLVKK